MNETYQHPGSWEDTILVPTLTRSDPTHFIMSHVIKGLSPNSVYEVMIQARNAHGWNEVRHTHSLHLAFFCPFVWQGVDVFVSFRDEPCHERGGGFLISVPICRLLLLWDGEKSSISSARTQQALIMMDCSLSFVDGGSVPIRTIQWDMDLIRSLMDWESALLWMSFGLLPVWGWFVDDNHTELCLRKMCEKGLMYG